MTTTHARSSAERSAAITARRRLTPLIATGAVRCWRCHQPIHPAQPWDLGHTTDRAFGGTTTAPEHRWPTATCPGNRGAGGWRTANANRQRRKQQRRDRW